MGSAAADIPHVVVVGGGAGGLELASRLGRRAGRRERIRVTLVDASLTHLWKPLLHEVAAGTLDSGADALDYLAQARQHGFTYQLGRMVGLDRGRRRVRLAAITDEAGRALVPARELDYDWLVLAVGSVSNDFGTPGVAEHCVFLDDAAAAERFQQMLMRALLGAQLQETPLAPEQLSVAIVGGGATGVELAAELRSAARKAAGYGLDRIDPERDLTLTVIEAAERILPALSPGLSAKTHARLEELGVRVLTGRPVTEVTDRGMHVEGGEFVPAELRVWSAGIRAPAWLQELEGLATTRSGQLVVDECLRTADPRVFALGDCAAQTPPGADRPLPPRAQTASQQAEYLARHLPALIAGRTPPPFVYRDYGSLISLTERHAVGRLMGSVFGNWMIEGLLARAAYASLYRKHLAVVHGLPRMLLISTLQWLARRTRPRLKLH
ncbi:NAD(P)/FAD-dependent oxidoreductase [Spiribacter halobius]|uniref:NAD(P)/FAD-dependent oxidoreductase n=1 Tax=Sediminicurvatus halobius TaxID=2182432 RepID=UPI001E58FBF9|nr:NAD(P)/FAD-dependent oxidoreductase [Spiribacter halobius]UEX79234.1 NAD(P)/FAD-dependent oxidoreductase [Spiribacter halobius]